MKRPGLFPLVYVFIPLILLLSSCGQEKSGMELPLITPLPYGYYTIEEYLQTAEAPAGSYSTFRRLVQEPGLPVEPGKVTGSVRIAMIYPGTERSDYWIRSISSFSARMDELNIPHEVLEFFSRPGSIDQEMQDRQIQEALQADPDYLVFTLDVQRHKDLLERIITLGRPKIILQNITTPLREWRGNQPLLYVGFSHRIGTLSSLAPEFLRRVGPEGSYGLLYFTKGFVSEQRGDTFVQYMEENSSLKLQAAFYTDGQYDKARAATEQIIEEYPDIDFIYACSTNIALAAVEVLKERGLKDRVLVNGWGGGSAELESLALGELDFTVMRMNDDNGVAMAEAVRLDLLGRPEEVPALYSGDFQLVTQDTGREERDAFMERAFRYSGIHE